MEAQRCGLDEISRQRTSEHNAFPLSAKARGVTDAITPKFGVEIVHGLGTAEWGFRAIRLSVGFRDWGYPQSFPASSPQPKE
jgi:hypothetical protein